MAVSDLSTDGFNAQSADVEADDDGYENTTLHLNSHYDFNDNITARLTVRDTDATNEYDGCFDNATFALIHACTSDTENTTARLSVEYTSGDNKYSVSVSETDVERSFFSNDQFSFANKGKIRKYDFLGRSGFGSATLVYGADLKQETLTNTSQERDQKGLFAEYSDELVSNWFINAGIRYDDNDTFGSNVSHRIGSAYIIEVSDLGAVKFKGSYGTGFRAPSLFEQSYNDGPFAYGEAAGLALKEETSEGIDLGIELFADSGLQASITWFSQQIENEIQFDNVAFQGYLQADGESESDGVELAVSQDITEQVSVKFNYTYNDTATSTDANRLRRPKHVANLAFTANWLDDKLQTLLTARLVRDAVGIGELPLDDYEVVNLSARYELHDQLAVSARVENLLDEEYQEVLGFNSAERSAYLGFELSF